jgi:hypothetical protein
LETDLARMTTAFTSLQETCTAQATKLAAIERILLVLKLSTPADADELVTTMETLSTAHMRNNGLLSDVRTLEGASKSQQQQLQKIQQEEERVRAQLATLQSAVRAAQGSGGAARAVSSAHAEGERMLVVRAAAGTTVASVKAAIAQCVRCDQSAIQQVHTATGHTASIRDPRVPAVTTPQAGSRPPAGPLFVVTLASRHLVVLALKGVECRRMLKVAFNMKIDDYLTREQLRQRMFMRPTQQRLQDQGVVATFRGVDLYQLVPPPGASRTATKRWFKVDRPLDARAGDNVLNTAAARV